MGILMHFNDTHHLQVFLTLLNWDICSLRTISTIFKCISELFFSRSIVLLMDTLVYPNCWPFLWCNPAFLRTSYEKKKRQKKPSHDRGFCRKFPYSGNRFIKIPVTHKNPTVFFILRYILCGDFHPLRLSWGFSSPERGGKIPFSDGLNHK